LVTVLDRGALWLVRGMTPSDPRFRRDERALAALQTLFSSLSVALACDSDAAMATFERDVPRLGGWLSLAKAKKRAVEEAAAINSCIGEAASDANLNETTSPGFERGASSHRL
jgi:hypothetical protein